MKPPAFQFYPADFLVGCAELSAEETGAYIRLLCYQWSKGGLPSDPSKLAILGGCTSDALASIMHKFCLSEDGCIRNARLEEERKKQAEFRASRSENAKKGWNRSTSNARAQRVHKSSICTDDALQSSSASSKVPPTPKGERKASESNVPTSEQAKRIAVMFGRRLTTAWSEKEIKQFKSLIPINQEDLAMVEQYYLSEASNPDNHLRRDLLTLLNNWNGEVDRAVRWKNLPSKNGTGEHVRQDPVLKL